MTLVRKKITTKAFPRHVFEYEGVRNFIPQYLLDRYDNTKQTIESMSYYPEDYFTTDIDIDVNDFLRENSITKEQLHSIEMIPRSFIGDFDCAVIIYEEANKK